MRRLRKCSLISTVPSQWHRKHWGQARPPIVVPHSLPSKRPLATQLQVAMEIREGEHRGRGGCGAVQTPLAAHSMVINDHPSGADSGLGGERRKQALSSLSECKCHSQQKYSMSEGWRERPGWFLLWLQIGDRKP